MSRPQRSTRDYYDILGADVTTSARDIEILYKRQAARCHPDRGGSEEAMKDLNEAYSVLKDSSTRRAYDEKRTRPTPRPFVPASQPAAQDIGAFGLFLRSFLCVLMGLFLLLLVRIQWFWFLWPLVLLAVLVLLFGILMARNAVKAWLPIGNVFHRHAVIREFLFWGLVLTGCCGAYLLLMAVE
jgi:hypothetical protein